MSGSLRAVRERLEGRNQAGFITNKEWHRIMDTKVHPKGGVVVWGVVFLLSGCGFDLYLLIVGSCAVSESCLMEAL